MIFLHAEKIKQKLHVFNIRPIRTIDLPPYAALSEEQTVLGESPRFVTQQVSHLAELLIQ